ncbi:MAG: RNA chaperone Hfq, partial [Acidobacteria bacterium]|nr:RNA chaperone Hfq [Acidobacteriota bacterium]
MQDKDIAGSLQNDFFNQAKRDRSRLTVFLNSGKKLTGRIKGFDRFTIILDGPGGEQMIFKHAIATVNSIRTFGNYMDVDGAVRRGG